MASTGRSDVPMYAPIDKYGNLSVGAHCPVVVYSTDGAISLKDQVAILTKATASNMTLAAPVATLQDGMTITVINQTAVGHTVTTPSAKINGLNNTFTCTAAAGNAVTFVAYNGVWYTSSLKTGSLSTV